MGTVKIVLDIPQELAERYTDIAQSLKQEINSLYIEALKDFVDQYDADCELLNDPEFLQEQEDLRAGRLKTYSLEEVIKKLSLDD